MPFNPIGTPAAPTSTASPSTSGWLAGAAQDVQTADQAISAQLQPGGQFGGYPAMQNPYGLGSVVGGGTSGGGTPTPGSASAPSFNTTPVTSNQAATDSSSRGFNPWSMQGEANARSAQS